VQGYDDIDQGLDWGSLQAIALNQPYPMVFVTVSGAHLYGFASPDSDVDLRGVHLLSAQKLLGLDELDQTLETSSNEGFELDLVTHDLGKFIKLMLRPNGYVLEQLYSPLVVLTSPEHEELKQLGQGCITRHHVHHYLGFARNQWGLFTKENPPRIKPLLYVYRVLLTGIYLMQTGVIQASLPRLNEQFRIEGIDELIRRKREEKEQAVMDEAQVQHHKQIYESLLERLNQAGEQSSLPEAPSSRAGLDDLLIRLRKKSICG
jgi:predicted nucleotidyltransferase